jgi:ABC-type amino acid transport system permease subunit
MTEGRTFGTISRRGLLAGLGGVAALSALAACSPGGGTSETIKFWNMPWGGTPFSPLDQKITLAYKPASGLPAASYQAVQWANFTTTFATAIVSKTGPAVSSGSGTQAFQFAVQNYIAYADGLLASWQKNGLYDDFVPGVLAAMKTNHLLELAGRHPQSPLPLLAKHLGLGNVLFLADPTLAQVTVCIFKVWVSFPFMMMMASALTSIDANIYEASRVDGASGWQTFRLVTLPMIARSTYISWILMTIFCVNDFPTIFLLTGGGPVNSTQTLVVLAYTNVFQNFQTGPGVAMAFLMTIVLVAVSVTLYRQVRTPLILAEKTGGEERPLVAVHRSRGDRRRGLGAVGGGGGPVGAAIAR